MLFSIIIPVYNVENYLQECIDSVVNQIVNYAIDAEIVLLDDGSKDMSGKICDNNYNKYPDIIRVVHKKMKAFYLQEEKVFYWRKVSILLIVIQMISFQKMHYMK